MNRLPSYDARTRNAEHYLFLGLLLAAAGLITMAIVNASRFSANRQDIIAALSRPSPSLVETGRTDTSTNLAVQHSGRPEERTRVDVNLRPKS